MSIHIREIARKLMVLLAGALCTSGAMAMSYTIDPGDETNMCRAVRAAFAAGMVLDAEHPLCERRLDFSPKAKSLGLESIHKNLLSPASYENLLLQFSAVSGQKHRLHITYKEVKQNEFSNVGAIRNLLQNFKVRIYASTFDADNRGQIHKVYIVDVSSCRIKNLKNSYDISAVTTYIQNSDGTLDPTWGTNDQTAGIPFIYDDRTYYLRWESLNGSPDKDMLAQINIFSATPYGGVFAQNSPYNAFAPPICTIYQSRKSPSWAKAGK